MRTFGGEVCAWLCLALCTTVTFTANAEDNPCDAAFSFLNSMMDRHHDRFAVYTDAGDAGNHFQALAKMPDESATVTMDTCDTEHAYEGESSIKATFRKEAGAPVWGGFYFLNGVLKENHTQPSLNWGSKPHAGFNLTGARRVTFYARGAQGGERVQFFVGGAGWSTDHQGNSVAKEVPYPDSLPKVSTGFITLTEEWQQFEIDLSGKDLRYVIGGFGWTTDAYRNAMHDEVSFYIDDIQWELDRKDKLRFLASYERHDIPEHDDPVLRDVAFTYDNALALLAFLAKGDMDGLERARLLANSFVYSVHYDRYYEDYRLRNAYTAADLPAYPGWSDQPTKRAARLPCYWNCKEQKPLEDQSFVGSYSGNAAWAMIALLAAFDQFDDRTYLNTAHRLGQWVVGHCKDDRGAGGFTAGYEGWKEQPEKKLWKSTEHNLDLYVAFRRLYEATDEHNWLAEAAHAKAFTEAMWDDVGGKFWTGTLENGVDINTSVVPLDAQAWATLAFRAPTVSRIRALQYVKRNHAVGSGFDYNTDKDGIWYEGTAQMATALHEVGGSSGHRSIINVIERAQHLNGAIPSASKPEVTTGFDSATGSDLTYGNQGHVGATAWYIFAKLGVNPYWFSPNDPASSRSSQFARARRMQDARFRMQNTGF